MTAFNITVDVGDEHFEVTDVTAGPTTGGDLATGAVIFVDFAKVTKKEEMVGILQALMDHTLEQDYPPVGPT